MKNFTHISVLFLSILTFFFSKSGVYSQCSFTGLEPTYCVSDPDTTLVGDPLGGAFSGPGISGDTFDPAAAGVGTHTISYDILGGGTGDKYYIKSNIGNPWGSVTNQAAMDLAFGLDAWTLESFELVDVAAVFSPTTGIVFIDGSDGQATELNTFLITNLPSIEAWVTAGGRLLLNSAPNEGSSMDFGFGGTNLVYGGVYANDVTVVDPLHPAIVGPNTPTITAMSGTYYSHAHVTGPGYTTVITETGLPSNIILFEKEWGGGRVMMGGMTTTNWHSPSPQAANWRANLLVYLYGDAGEPCTYTQDVIVLDDPDVILTVTPDEICLGETVTYTLTGDADSYVWSEPGITDGIPYEPADLGLFTIEVTGAAGACSSSATADVTVHAVPEANFLVDPLDYCIDELIPFFNTSIVEDASDTTWLWEFGDGSTSGVIHAAHAYGAAGTYTVTLTATTNHGCSDDYSVDIVVHDSPTASFEFSVAGFSSEDGATGGCVDNVVIFENTSTIPVPETITDSFWNFGDGSTSTEFEPSHTYVSSGTYTITLTVTSEYGCTSTITKTIIMIDELTLDLVVSEPSCYGFSDGSIIVNIDAFTGEVIYSITDPSGTLLNVDNSNAANSLSSGWYYINVTDESACDGVDSIYLDQPTQIDIDLTVSNAICYGENSGWARVDSVYNTTGSYSFVSYGWDPNPAGVGGIGADSTWNLTEGDYIVTINDENGCSRVFDFSITEPDSLYFVEFGYDPAYCRLFDYQSGNGVVFASAAGGTPDYNYEWTNLETGETTINTTWGGLNPGNYEIIATDGNGCVITQALFLDSLNPIAAFEMTSDQFTAEFEGYAPMDVHFVNQSENYSNPNNPSGESTFMWNFEYDAIDWELTNDFDETFDWSYQARGISYDVNVCLIAINKNGCADTACKIINIYEPLTFEAVNIFSPNGDGKNDTFTFEFKTSSISEFKCTIVDRWGLVITELNSITDGWDGSDKGGNKCPDGVYFYSYEAITDSGVAILGQGTLQLIGGK
ncbi:MAG: PKD domain-containing protein [Crocinitomicaceae bacterium]|nr:PKD domain-containing protein [Crocinitomicaceae bacterium]